MLPILRTILITLSLNTWIFCQTKFCQPLEACWPNQEIIEEFVSSLSETEGCHDLPTFSSYDQQGEPMKNIWYPELEEEITPYNLLTTRNSVSGNKAYFVVLARTEADVISSIKFAKSHSMALSVFSTGHEFNDRNGGLATNSILIRTTCLRTADINLEPSTVFNHTEGVIRLGFGMTWSWSKFGDVGVHQLANQVGRVVVSGHAGNVGIVGWSLGGGHGQLVGTYGMGVDQVLEVEMIIANGTKVIANAMSTTQVLQDGTQLQSEDSSLFWALRGGGAGPWGVITAMKIKLHKPRNDCKENCFTQWHASWVGSYAEDGPELLQELIHNYLKWSGTSSKYWSSYASPYSVDDDHFGFAIFEALFVGTEKDNDFLSFFETFSSVRTDKMVDIGSKTYDTFLKKIEDQTLETVMPKWEVEPMTSVLMNSSSVANMAAAEMLAYNWIPRCYLQWTPCIGGILFMHTVSTGEEDDYYTGTAVSPMFRQAKMHVSALSYISLTHEMSFEEKVKFAHEEIGPEFYKFGSGSYYSESEYSLGKGEWQTRFWTQDIYNRLLAIKREWDPDFLFGCKHCVGDEEEP